MQTVYIFINGIRAFPGDSRGWTDRAVTWTHLNTAHRAEKFEYFTTATFRRLYLNWWAAELAHLVVRYRRANHKVVLVGHSNGCEVIVRALSKIHDRVEEVHLISPACDSDFCRTELNCRMHDERLGRICVYRGGSDWAMTCAKITSIPLRLLGLGYGYLGLTGPIGVAQACRDRVEELVEPDFGHSTWFNEEAFDRTMQLVTQTIKEDLP